jgi:hypothetical protein
MSWIFNGLSYDVETSSQILLVVGAEFLQNCSDIKNDIFSIFPRIEA